MLTAEDKYRVLVEQVPAITYLVRVGHSLKIGVDSPTLFVSPQVETILGFTPEEWTNTPDLWLRMVHPDDRERVVKAVEASNRERRPFDLEYRVRHRRGHYVVIFNSSRYLQGQDGRLYTEGLMFDMTWRKRLTLREKFAHECAESFRSMGDLAAVGHWLRERLGDVMPASNLMIALYDEVKRIVTFPVSFDEADPPPPPRPPGRFMTDYVLFNRCGHHHGNPEHCAALARMGYQPAGTPSSDWIGVPLRDADRVIGVIALQTYNPDERYRNEDLHFLDELAQSLARRIVDIRAADALRASEARLRTLFDTVPALAVQGYDIDGKVVYWNDASTALYGYTREEAIGRTLYELIIPEAMVDGVHQAVSAMMETQVPIPSGELELCRKDGSLTTVYSSHVYLEDEYGNPRMYCLDLDMNERKRHETQMLRTQRLEGLGNLAGGMAHDLNNTLTPILMSAELLRITTDPQEVEPLITTIEQAARRGADMVKQVLAFARGVEGERSLLNPVQVVREIESLVRDTFPRTIHWRIDVPKDIRAVIGDTTQLHQILLNLCINARDAMPGGGALSIELTNQEVDEQRARTLGAERGGTFVRIAVTDTGCGIPPEIIDRVCDPFFTTKEPGKGSGIGLSTVHAITRSHGGFLQIHSVQGKGSEFEVYLPAASVDLEPDGQKKHVPELAGGDQERILVVDADTLVRTTLKTILKRSGYRVVTAASRTEANAIVQRGEHEINAIVLDMTGVEPDGDVVLATTAQPPVPVITVSGPATDPNLEGRPYTLTKPYSASEVLAVIRRALDEARPPV